MKTIIAPVRVETRGKKCGRCRFVKNGPDLLPVCSLFQERLNYTISDKTCYVSRDRLLQCLACDEV